MTCPSFYVSKGERKLLGLQFDPFQRYLTIAQGIYEWTGLPDDVPVGFIEQSLFNYGCLSAKNVDGLGVCIFAASPNTWTIYNEPAKWIPTGVNATNINRDIINGVSDNPCLYLGMSVSDKIASFASIQAHSLISLRQNVIAMRQPIALDGNPGNSADAFVLQGEIEGGENYIPVINSGKLGVKTIDLNATDFTSSLINVYDAMDREILSYMGIRNAGTEKLSGITSEETMSITQELTLVSTLGLKERMKWCDKINAVLGTNFSVRIADAYVMSDSDEDKIPDSLDYVDDEPTKEPEEL